MDVESKVATATRELDRLARAATTALEARNKRREAAESAPGWAHLNAEGKRAQLDEIDAPMLEAERAVFQAVTEALKASDELERFGEAPAQLPDEALARASNLAQFAREDVESDRSGETTAAQLADAIAEGDKARTFVLSRYSRARIAAEREAGRSWGVPALLDALKRADGLMADPTRAKARDEAVALRKRARETRQALHEARRDEHAAGAMAHVRGQRSYAL